jgi:hypothetical protein
MRHDALTITRDAISEHVTRQDRETVSGVPLRLTSGVIVEAGSAVHEQQPRTRVGGGIIPGEEPG